MTTLATTQAAGLTLGDALTALADFIRLDVAEGDASPHTLRAIYGGIDAFTRWARGADVNPTAATDDHIRGYRAYLVEQGYTPATIAQRLYALRRFYAAAVWRGLRPDNPAQGIKAPTDPTDPTEKVKFLPLAGFEKLLNLPDRTTRKGRRDRAILALLGIHGLRVFEAAGLTLGSIDGDKVAIVGKRKKRRSIHLTPGSRARIDAWLGDRAMIRPDNEAVFVSLGNRSYGQPLTVRAIRHLVDGYLASAGLKAHGISCHSLRHSFATWATYRGAKAEHLQADMGHSSRDVLAIYQGLVDRVKNNPALLLGDLLEEPTTGGA